MRKVPRAFAALAAGRVIALTGADAYESCLVSAADLATAADLTFMQRHGRGAPRLVLAEGRAAALGLRPVADSGRAFPVAGFIGGLDARDGITTGASAADRARTARTAADPRMGPADFHHGGHVDVIAASELGVIGRPRAAEASIDLARLAGHRPATVLCHVLNTYGSLVDRRGVLDLARRHDLVTVSIDDVVAYRWARDNPMRPAAEAALPTTYGSFAAIGFTSPLDPGPHLALVKGDVEGGEEVLMSIHIRCLMGDVFRATTCTCAQRLDEALAALGRTQRGVLVHLTPPNPGSSDPDPSACGRRMPARRESRTAERRNVGAAAQILESLGVASARLLHDEPLTARALRQLGVQVARPGVEELRPVGHLDDARSA
jgi:3,4-dihydroxy 2-butanone 4-phosphate synthase/GTP cyclohydrolase II